MNSSFASQVLGTSENETLWNRVSPGCVERDLSLFCNPKTGIPHTSVVHPSSETLPSYTIPAAPEVEHVPLEETYKHLISHQNGVRSWSRRYVFHRSQTESHGGYENGAANGDSHSIYQSIGNTGP